MLAAGCVPDRRRLRRPHRRPRPGPVRNGPNTLANLVACCDPCNRRKHAGDPVGERLGRLVDCGRTTVAHAAHGRCRTCYRRNKAAGQ